MNWFVSNTWPSTRESRFSAQRVVDSEFNKKAAGAYEASSSRWGARMTSFDAELAVILMVYIQKSTYVRTYARTHASTHARVYPSWSLSHWQSVRDEWRSSNMLRTELQYLVRSPPRCQSLFIFEKQRKSTWKDSVASCSSLSFSSQLRKSHQTGQVARLAPHTSRVKKFWTLSNKQWTSLRTYASRYSIHPPADRG
jgi:hypothetical protein